ncbi:hypothetical protein M0D21_13785 [Aquimarina sp. D1M17]|uniref:MauE/DoxX family redox-associated membrane protein n=1 Tax=Aquimarina acroporae TaxID=2937283 RepID=UPI0020BE698A|nr:MauE/DoxX family redox-associated membrane protein [Aquimarina acroporae]MCK8522650.1 hypothetical protein [Aquimarina acroporae]
MKFKIYLYHFIRISFGMLLVLYSVYNVIKYSGFLSRLDQYFNSASVFDVWIIEALAPLVPFEEFIIGFFLVLGMFTRKVLVVSTFLLAFFTLFLFDAGYTNCALIHLVLCTVSIILLKKDNYNINSFHYDNTYKTI